MSLLRGWIAKIEAENEGESANEKKEENDPDHQFERVPNHRRFPKNVEIEAEQVEEKLISFTHDLLIRQPFNLGTFAQIIRKREEFSRGVGDYENMSSCLDFLRDRKFLFEKRLQDKYYRNQGFGHSKAVMKIVQFIHEKSVYPSQCTLTDLAEFYQRGVESGGMEVYNDSWFVEGKPAQAWHDHFTFPRSVSTEVIARCFVDYHQEIVSITNCGDGRIIVDLNQLAYNIPSLWNEDLLPKEPTKGRFFDLSRTDVFVAMITSATYGHKGIIMQACICIGFFKGRRIRIFEEYPTDRSKIPQVPSFPKLVCVNAHFTLGCNYEFYGIKLVPVPPGYSDADLHKLERMKWGDVEKEAPALSTAHASLKDLIAAEKSLINFVDEIFGKDTLSDGQILERAEKRKNPVYEDFFRTTQAVLEFVQERPHLYYNGHHYWALSLVGRSINNALLGLLNVKKGKTLEQIRNGLRTAPDDDDLQLISEYRLKNIIDSVASLLVIKENPNRTVYSLKAYYDQTEKTLLPGYPRTNKRLPN